MRAWCVRICDRGLHVCACFCWRLCVFVRVVLVFVWICVRVCVKAWCVRICYRGLHMCVCVCIVLKISAAAVDCG